MSSVPSRAPNGRAFDLNKRHITPSPHIGPFGVSDMMELGLATKVTETWGRISEYHGTGEGPDNVRVMS